MQSKHEVTSFCHSLPLKNGFWWKVTVFFHFPGPNNLKNGDNTKSPKNELLGFAMQQENESEVKKQIADIPFEQYFLKLDYL